LRIREEKKGRRKGGNQEEPLAGSDKRNVDERSQTTTRGKEERIGVGTSSLERAERKSLDQAGKINGVAILYVSRLRGGGVQKLGKSTVPGRHYNAARGVSPKGGENVNGTPKEGNLRLGTKNITHTQEETRLQ